MRGLLKIIIGLFIFLFISQTAFAARDILLELTVRQENDEGKYQLIEKRDLTLAEGKKVTTFITNFTIDFIIEYNDNGLYKCEFSLYTLGPRAQNLFKKFQSQEGGVFFIDNVRGKNGITYRVGLSPLAVDSSISEEDLCQFDYHTDGVWKFDPSANFDFYFVPQTLGDARWNMLRDYVEINYKQFKKKFEPGFPGKINYFFSPCQLREVIWDKRAGYAIDPPRSNCFAIYSHDHNTIDAFGAYLVRIYRYMGYSPPLLAEGMAGHFDIPHYYAQELKEKSELPPLSSMLKSIDYYGHAGFNNISTASSFVKYMIDNYGQNRFTELFKKSHDLNIASQFDSVYLVSMDSLETEWLHFLDTLNIPITNYRYFYERDKYVHNRTGMDRFLAELKENLITREDSLFVYGEEGWNLYMDGDYDTARKIYETLINMEPNDASRLMIYANLLLIDGQYDSALVMYDTVNATDTTVKTIFYKKGDTYFRMGNVDSAKVYLLRDLTEDPSQLSRASSGILLGRITLAEGDTLLAHDYYADALNAMERIYQFGRTSPAYLLRLGQVHIGLAMCNNEPYATAQSYLDQALYFEVYPTRVIFITRILRELGRLADIEGRREEAIKYYQQALSFPLPPDFETETRGYVIEPFIGY